MFWGTNISVRATQFRAAGGFDEDFRSWGSEDIELGLRLHHRNVPFLFSRDAWAIETPHERDTVANVASNQRNALMLLHKHPEPVAELTWAFYMKDLIWPIEHEYRALIDLIRETRRLDVRDEVARMLRELPPGAATRIAVIGCGGTVPSLLPEGSVLMDFDQELLATAVADDRHVGHHAIGLRTTLPDQSIDVVILTSRLSGLWARWSTEVLAEAHRIGRAVHVGGLAGYPAGQAMT
jgi:hypothetical protein